MNWRFNKFWDSLGRGLTSLVLASASFVIAALPIGTASAAGTCTLGSWTTTTALPVPLSAAASTVYNGYVYEIGGISGSTEQSGVHYAAFGSNGAVGAWTTSPHSLPQALSDARSIAYNGYIYVMGGSNAGVDKSVVYYAQLASDGSVGTWTTSGNSLPVAANSSMAVTSNGYVYVMGGRAGSPVQTGVYYARLNANGSVGTWTTSSHPLPQGMAYGSATTYGGYVYAMAGYNGSSNLSVVYYAQLASDGSVGTWTTSANALPQTATSGAAAVVNGYIFEIRGGGTTNVSTTALNVNGSMGTWSGSTALPGNIMSTTSATYNGYLYVLGGYNGGTVSTVYKAPLTGDCANAPTPNNDFDGVASSAENAAPNTGDANNDQIQDGIQSNVTSLLNPVTSTYAALESTCAANSSVSLTSSASQATADTSYTYPAGLMDFSLACTSGATATITMYYYGLPLSSELVMRKYNSTTHSYAAISNAVFSTVTIGGQSATKVVYQVTDGGALDADGLANGVIVDPAGPAVLAASTVATPAVTAPSTGARPLSAWVYAMAAILGLVLVTYVGRKSYIAAKTR